MDKGRKPSNCPIVITQLDVPRDMVMLGNCQSRVYPPYNIKVISEVLQGKGAYGG